MKRMALLVLGIVAASTSAFAQAALDNDTILLAAPANLRAEATVIKWKPDHTYDTIKKGTNKMVCYDRSGFPNSGRFQLSARASATLTARLRTSSSRRSATRRRRKPLSTRRKKTAPA